jgi:hypothetical protein
MPPALATSSIIARSAAGGIESEAKAMNLGASPMPSLVMVPASATIRSKVEDVLARIRLRTCGGLTGVAASVRLGLVGACPGLPRQSFGSGASIGGERLGIVGPGAGPRPDGRQIEVRLGCLCRCSRQSGKARKRSDYKEMRKLFHSAQQFRLRQTR